MQIRRQQSKSAASALGFSGNVKAKHKANALAIAAFTGLFVKKMKLRHRIAKEAKSTE